MISNDNGLICQQVIYGTCYSKSNNRIRAIIKGVKRSIKSAGANRFVKDFLSQCKTIPEPYEGAVAIKGAIFYPNNRFDLDPALVHDCIEKAGLIKNDRQIFKSCFDKGIDKENPRVVFAVRAIDAN